MDPPLPDPETLTLQMDERIVLTAKKFDLRLDFLYHSDQGTTEYGQHRAALVRQFINSSVTAKRVTIVRGDVQQYSFSIVSGGGYVAKTKGILTTLAFDGTSFTEYYGDGHQLIYQAQSQVGNPVVHQLMVNVEPAGTRQTFAYGTGTEAGLLKTIEVNDGNLVTFNYGPGTNTSLLYTLEDWGARIWTYQYDVNDCYTTVTQPSGCITKYGIDAFQRVKTRQNPQGFLATYTYSGTDGKIFKATVADGARFYNLDSVDNSYTAETLPNGAIVTYNGAGLPGSIQTPDGTTTVVNYDANDIESARIAPSGSLGTTLYDSSGLATSYKDPLGYITSYSHDSYGNLTKIQYPDNAVVTNIYEGSVQLTCSPRARIRLETSLLTPTQTGS